jgi:Flp pilus assembly protein TadD
MLARERPGLGDDLYFKLGNIAYKRRDHARARESWAQATSLNPGHQLARANLEMLDLTQ